MPFTCSSPLDAHPESRLLVERLADRSTTGSTPARTSRASRCAGSAPSGASSSRRSRGRVCASRARARRSASELTSCEALRDPARLRRPCRQGREAAPGAAAQDAGAARAARRVGRVELASAVDRPSRRRARRLESNEHRRARRARLLRRARARRQELGQRRARLDPPAIADELVRGPVQRQRVERHEVQHVVEHDTIRACVPASAGSQRIEDQLAAAHRRMPRARFDRARRPRRRCRVPSPTPIASRQARTASSIGAIGPRSTSVSERCERRSRQDRWSAHGPRTRTGSRRRSRRPTARRAAPLDELRAVRRLT